MIAILEADLKTGRGGKNTGEPRVALAVPEWYLSHTQTRGLGPASVGSRDAACALR